MLHVLRLSFAPGLVAVLVRTVGAVMYTTAGGQAAAEGGDDRMFDVDAMTDGAGEVLPFTLGSEARLHAPRRRAYCKFLYSVQATPLLRISNVRLSQTSFRHKAFAQMSAPAGKAGKPVGLPVMHVRASGVTAPVNQDTVRRSGLLRAIGEMVGPDCEPVPLSISMRDFAAWQAGPPRSLAACEKRCTRSRCETVGISCSTVFVVARMHWLGWAAKR